MTTLRAIARTAADLLRMAAWPLTRHHRARKRAQAAEHAAFVARARFAQDRQRHAPEGSAGITGRGIDRDVWVGFCHEVSAIFAGMAGSDGQQ